MGAADVVPGVSGGTIAFISGIYEELVSSIDGVNLGLLKVLKQEGFTSFWKKANGKFLLTLLSGIAVSVFSLENAISFLLGTTYFSMVLFLWSCLVECFCNF